jgi:hypothetical protein
MGKTERTGKDGEDGEDFAAAVVAVSAPAIIADTVMVPILIRLRRDRRIPPGNLLQFGHFNNPRTAPFDDFE